jgi:hypothetical protein
MRFFLITSFFVFVVSQQEKRSNEKSTRWGAHLHKYLEGNVLFGELV